MRMVKNRFKERITECAFDNEPLRKVYEMICNLETPYIWYADSFSGEQLYLINDLETEKEVTSYSWHIDDIEFLGPSLDVIGLRLCRMSGKSVDNSYKSISCRSNFADKEITAEKLLIQAGFRIPNGTEFESVNFVGDIPGNTKEGDEALKKKRIIYLKESILEDESKIVMYEKKREILEPVLRSLQYDIEQCSSRVKYANQRIEQARKELIGLQTN